MVRRLLLALPLVLSIALITGRAEALGTLDQSNTATADSIAVVAGGAPNVSGQIFTAGLSGTLDTARLDLVTDTPGIFVTLALYATDGAGNPTVQLASASAAVTVGLTLPPGPSASQYTAFTFASPAAVSAGTQYALLLLPPQTAGAVFWWSNLASPYTRGFATVSPSGLGGPCFPAPGSASNFQTFVTLPPPTRPATVTLALTPPTPLPGTAATLAATVTCPTSTPTGSVTFSSGVTTLGTVPVSGGTASLPIVVPADGILVVVATYNGDPLCGPGSSAAFLVHGTVPASLPAIYTLSIPHTGCGSTTPSNIPVLALQNVSITAVACPGSNFVGWTGGPCDTATVKIIINPCSIPAGVPVTANFTP